VRLTLRIERLVVDGLPVARRDRAALAAAVEAELAIRLRDDLGGWPSFGTAVRTVRGAPVGVAAGRPVAALGAEVARSIHAALGQAARA
jgi:hypothetical protein